MSRAFRCFQFLIYCVVVSKSTNGENVRSDHTDPGASVRHLKEGRKWITQLMEEAKNAFDIHPEANARCQRDFNLYKLHLQNQSTWAVRMAESSEWPTVGIIAGTMNHLGNWFDCTLVSNEDINGQYCVVTANYHLTRSFSNVPSDSKSNEVEPSAWNIFEQYEKQPWKLDRQIVKWALCVPSSCQAADVEVSLEKTLKPIFQRQDIQISVTINPDSCSKPLENWWKNYEMGYNLFWIFTKCILVIMLFSTVYHYLIKNDDENKSEPRSLKVDILTSFSVIRNYKSLTTVSPNDIPSMYLVKILYTFLTVLGHRTIFFYSFPFFNSQATEMDIYLDGNLLFGFFHSELIMVDIFFMFSGFILFTSHLSKMKVEGWSTVIEGSLYRWARMVPAHTFTLVIMIYILPSLNDGPLWYLSVAEAERCKSSLWSNFFAVSNIFDSEKMCLFHSWYPSVDIQLTIIGSVILMVYARNERLGRYLTALVFSAGTAYIFVYTYINKYHGVLPTFVGTGTFYKERNSIEFLNSYISTSIRIASYLTGFACGIVIEKLAEIKFKFTEENVFVLFLPMICSKIAFMNYITELYEVTKPYNRFENAVSAVTLHLLFVLPEAVLFCAYVNARKCRYLLFFDSPVWVPLGKLLYGIFIISPVIQFFHSASHQVLMPSYSLIYIFWLFIGDIVYSIIGAFILYMTIQAPVFNLLKICIHKSIRQIYAVLASKIPVNCTTQSVNDEHNKKL